MDGKKQMIILLGAFVAGQSITASMREIKRLEGTIARLKSSVESKGNFLSKVKDNFLVFDTVMEETYYNIRKTFLGNIVLGYLLPSMIGMATMYAIMTKLRADAAGNAARGLITHEIKPIIVEDTSIKDYAGTVPEEVVKLVDYIQNREAYKIVNAPSTKGILLTGLPGTGKSFLARAIAGTVGCPFFATSAAEFSQPFIGTSEMMIRDIFAKARLAAANDLSKSVIIFIDELDAIGGRQQKTLGGVPIGTLTTFLTEMDGFDKAAVVTFPWYRRLFAKSNDEIVNVVILGATNAPENLDSALRRSGRFDRIIEVKNPDLAGRQAIADLYLKKKYPRHDDNVKADNLAYVTEGMSPADINTLFGEAARDAGSKRQQEIGIENFCHVLLAIKKDNFGSDKKKVMQLFITMYPCNQNITVDSLMKSSLGYRTIQDLGEIFEDAYEKVRSENHNEINMSDLEKDEEPDFT